MTYVSKAFPALLTLMGFVLRYPYGLLGMHCLEKFRIYTGQLTASFQSSH